MIYLDDYISKSMMSLHCALYDGIRICRPEIFHFCFKTYDECITKWFLKGQNLQNEIIKKICKFVLVEGIKSQNFKEYGDI